MALLFRAGSGAARVAAFLDVFNGVVEMRVAARIAVGVVSEVVGAAAVGVEKGMECARHFGVDAWLFTEKFVLVAGEGSS